MIILGIILLLVGVVAGVRLLYAIGGVLLVCGVVLWLMHAAGPVGGAWY